MSADLIVGAIAGAGWGTLIGFVLGARWLRAMIAEAPDEDRDA